MNLRTYIREHIRWSQKTFGEGAFSTRPVNHIRKELDELFAKPTDLEEWIDVIILALDGAWRAGYNAADIVKMLMAKLKKNQSRTFIIPKNPDQPAEHDRSQEEGHPMKKHAVTIADSEREIYDLREGLSNQTAAMISLTSENRHLAKTLQEKRLEVQMLEQALFQQQQYNAQAHETISVLVRKMPYAPQPAWPKVELVSEDVEISKNGQEH